MAKKVAIWPLASFEVKKMIKKIILSIMLIFVTPVIILLIGIFEGCCEIKDEFDDI